LNVLATAPELLTDDQVDRFRRDGFVIVEEGFISERAVERLRESFDRLFEGDYATGIQPDEVNWKPGRDPEDRTRQICNAEYSGRERAATFWRQMHEPWEFFRIDVEHIEDEGEWAIASLRFRARGADSGVAVDMRFGMAMRVSDGLGIEFLNRRTFDEARTAIPAAQPERDRTRT
jgi:ketosteroid isomerase-like protein